MSEMEIDLNGSGNKKMYNQQHSNHKIDFALIKEKINFEKCGFNNDSDTASINIL